MPDWAQICSGKKLPVSTPQDSVIVSWPNSCCVNPSSRIVNQLPISEILLQSKIIGIQEAGATHLSQSKNMWII